MTGKGSRKNNPDWEKISKEQTGNTRDSWRKKVRPAAAKSTKNTSSAKEDFQQEERDDRIETAGDMFAWNMRNTTFNGTLSQDDADVIARQLSMHSVHHEGNQSVLRYNNDYSTASNAGYFLLSLDNNMPTLKVSAGGQGSLWDQPETFIQDTIWEDFDDLSLEKKISLKARHRIASGFYMDSLEHCAEYIAEDTGMEVRDVSNIMVDYYTNVVLFDPVTDKYYRMHGTDHYTDVNIYGCVEVEPKTVDVDTFTAEGKDSSSSFDSPEVNNFLVALNQFSVAAGENESGKMKVRYGDITRLAKQLELDVIHVVADDEMDYELNPIGTGIETTSSTGKQNDRSAKNGYLIGDKNSGEYIAMQTEYSSGGGYNPFPAVDVTMAKGKPSLSGADVWKVTRSGSTGVNTWIALESDDD